MEAKRPLGLLTIRNTEGDLITFTIFTHFQNGVDYLNTIGTGAGWQKIKDNEFKSPTNHTVKVEMITPKFVDLKEEKYLWVNEDVKENSSSR